MANVIDQKIVEMRFDNKQFESGVKETMGTIKKLKENLDFKDVNMSGLEKSVKNIEKMMSPIGGAIQRNIGKAVDGVIGSVKNLFSEFSQIKAITSGFQEYETQMNAVQTILANTQKEGTTIKDVNKALDELNTYADKTIYNFTQMTKNIGTFTAAGVDLKTSVSAIQGIANLAAVSGSSAQQASTAMYQLSQALASGVVNLQDWNSVVNAGMGGQVFQDALKSTAKEMGKVVDESISFRESISGKSGNGWLTSDVLLETLKKFTTSGAAEYVAKLTNLTQAQVLAELELAKTTYGEADAIEKAAEALASKTGASKDSIVEALKFAQTAEDAATKVKTFSQLIDTLKEALQSGWAMSFRILIGDFEEAKAMFTDISDTLSALINAQSDARNRLLQEVFGKNDSSKFLSDALKTDTDTVNSLKELAKESGVASVEFVSALSKFTEGDAVLTDLYAKMFDFATQDKHVVEYIGDVFNIDKDSVRVLRAWGEEFGFASDIYKDQLSRMKVGGPIIENTITALLKMEYLMNRISGRDLLIDSFKNLYRVITEISKPIKEAWDEIFPKKADSATAIYNVIKGFNEFTKTLKISDEASKNIKGTFRSLFSTIKTLGEAVKGLFIIAKTAINPAIDFLKIIPEAENRTRGIVDSLKTWKEEMSNSGDSMKKLSFNMGYNIGVVIEWLSKLKNSISSIFEMDGIQVVLKSVGEAFSFVGVKAKEGSIYVRDNLKVIWESIKNFDFEKLSVIAKNVAMLLMAFSGFKALKAAKGMFENFGDLLGSVGGALDAYARNMNATALIKIAGAIAILAASLVLLTMVDSSKLMNAAIALSIVAGVLLTGAALLQKASNKGTQAAKALEIFATGVTKAMNTFAKSAYWTAVGAALIAFSIGLGSIIASIVTMYNLYNKDSSKLEQSIKMVGVIAAIMVGTIALLSLLNSKFVGGTAGMETASNTMKSLAVLMGVTTFAVAKIFGMTLPDDWKSRMIILGGVFLGLAGLALAVGFAGLIASGGKPSGAFANNPTIKKMFGGFLPTGTSGAVTAGPILALAATLTVAVGALQKVFDMSLPTDLDVRLKILAGLFLGIAGLAISVGYAGKLAGNSKSLTTSILAMTLMLNVATNSVVKLMSMPFPDNWLKRLGILESMFASLAILIVAVGGAGRLANGQLKATGTLVSMALLIAVVVGSLKILGELELGKLMQGAAALGIIFVTLGAALVGAGKITNADTAKSIYAMLAVILGITGSLVALSFISWPKLLKSVIAIEIILITLKSVFTSLSTITANTSLAVSIFGLATILGVTTGALMLLADKPWGNILISAIALSGVLFALISSFKMLNGMYIDNKAIASFVACAGSLVLMAFGLKQLEGMNWDQMLAGAVALGGVALALSYAFGIISKSGNVSINDIVAFAGMAVATIPIAYSLSLLKGMGISTLIGSALSLGLLVGAVSFALGIVGNTKANLGGVLGFVAMAIALIPMAYALNILKDSTIGDVLTSLIGLAGAMTIIGIAGTALGAAAGPIILGAAAVVAFSVAIGSIGIALKLFGDGIDAVVPMLKDLKTSLDNVFGGVGKAIGDALSKAKETMFKWFSGLGKLFSDGWNTVSKFFGDLFNKIGIAFGGFIKFIRELFSGIGEWIVTAFGGVGAGIVSVFKGAWNVLTGIWNWIVGLFKNGIDLSGIQTQFDRIFGNIDINWKNIWNSLVSAAQKAWTWLTNLWTGISTWFSGLNINWRNVWNAVVSGANIVFGWLQNIWNFIQPIFSKVITWIQNAWTTMSNWFRSIMTFLQPIFNTLKSFGGTIISWIGKAKTSFQDMISNIKTLITGAIDSVKKFFAAWNFSTLISAVKNFAETIKNVFSIFTSGIGGGVKTLWSFVSDAVGGVINFIKGLISTIVSIVSPIGDLLANVVAGAGEFIAKLTSPFSNAPALVQGAVATFIGFFQNIAITVQGIFAQIGSTITNIANFINTTIGSIVMNITSSASAFYNAGVTLVTNLSQGFLNGISNLVTGIQTGIQNVISAIIGFSGLFISAGLTMIANLMNGIASGISSMSGTVYSALTLFAQNIMLTLNTYFTMTNFMQMGINIISWFRQGIQSAIPLLMSAIILLCTNIITAFKNQLNRNVFYTIGRNISLWIAEGIRSGIPNCVSAARQLGSEVISALRSVLNRSNTFPIGEDAAMGIADGIRSKINAIARAAIEAARAAINAARAELQIASPSKKMIEVAKYFVEGFVVGVKRSTEEAVTSVEEMVDKILGSTDPLRNTEEYSLTAEFDEVGNPVITPIVDMTNVTNSAKEISNLMNRTFDISSTKANVSMAASNIESKNSKSSASSKSSEGNDGYSRNTYTFTQNNYSPKALTRSEIYRQTNNQFSAFRKAVNPS